MKTLAEHSEDPQLFMDGCNHMNHYYGVRPAQYSPDTEESLALKAKIKEVEDILKPLIGGFMRFYNFTSSGRVRYSYDYGHGHQGISFEGVGYTFVDELIELQATKS